MTNDRFRRLCRFTQYINFHVSNANKVVDVGTAMLTGAARGAASGGISTVVQNVSQKISEGKSIREITFADITKDAKQAMFVGAVVGGASEGAQRYGEIQRYNASIKEYETLKREYDKKVADAQAEYEAAKLAYEKDLAAHNNDVKAQEDFKAAQEKYDNAVNDAKAGYNNRLETYNAQRQAAIDKFLNDHNEGNIFEDGKGNKLTRAQAAEMHVNGKTVIVKHDSSGSIKSRNSKTKWSFSSKKTIAPAALPPEPTLNLPPASNAPTPPATSVGEPPKPPQAPALESLGAAPTPPVRQINQHSAHVPKPTVVENLPPPPPPPPPAPPASERGTRESISKLTKLLKAQLETQLLQLEESLLLLQQLQKREDDKEKYQSLIHEAQEQKIAYEKHLASLDMLNI